MSSPHSHIPPGRHLQLDSHLPLRLYRGGSLWTLAILQYKCENYQAREGLCQEQNKASCLVCLKLWGKVQMHYFLSNSAPIGSFINSVCPSVRQHDPGHKNVSKVSDKKWHGHCPLNFRHRENIQGFLFLFSSIFSLQEWAAKLCLGTWKIY